ncbi:dipeptidase PepE [Flavobacterium aciduliphilum]|uniref:Dipeptidase E n=1 Tax=Flavobacterium aciduliphilum TaxID=1101402 RepID=A0A328YCZ9_9FLAO|nr:dipeptidase PepE [Flavobacterium aciduliphilum]RAR71450.1 dipeptidase E [Flavobacterium aciduliphilum]
MKKLLIASTSTLFGGAYLEYLFPQLEHHFSHCESILFIPYARPGGITHDEYTTKVQEAFLKINKKIVGLHTFEDPITALKEAKGIFTGGGNTFLLVTELYKQNVMNTLAAVLNAGTPYIGTSAGSNITGISMQTTNDMPIVYPPSFDTLGILPFNLNPHYLDADLQSKHMGETRETRINEFHVLNTIPVLGLREGSWLEVVGSDIFLRGTLTARWFQKNHPAMELESGVNLNQL